MLPNPAGSNILAEVAPPHNVGIGLALSTAVCQPEGLECWALLIFGFGLEVAAAPGMYLGWSIMRSK